MQSFALTSSTSCFAILSIASLADWTAVCSDAARPPDAGLDWYCLIDHFQVGPTWTMSYSKWRYFILALASKGRPDGVNIATQGLDRIFSSGVLTDSPPTRAALPKEISLNVSLGPLFDIFIKLRLHIQM